MEKTKIVITGVAGFIGSNLAERLIKEGYQVVGIDNLSYGVQEQIPEGVEFHKLDIRSKEMYPLFSGAQAVFHLAAKNCISDCQADPVETADINVTGTVNVFEAARRASAGKVIYAESSAVYEGSDIFPTPETEMRPESFYAISKASENLFSKAYERFYQMKGVGLRYFNVYGPKQDYRRTVPPVMSAFIIKLLRGERPVIYGSGDKKRDFVYVDDINDFHLLCLRDDRVDGKVFNLGSGKNVSVLEIYKLASEITGKAVEPMRQPDLPGEAETTLADIREAKTLGWEPKTDLRQGMKKMVEFIKEEIARGRVAAK